MQQEAPHLLVDGLIPEWILFEQGNGCPHLAHQIATKTTFL